MLWPADCLSVSAGIIRVLTPLLLAQMQGDGDEGSSSERSHTRSSVLSVADGSKARLHLARGCQRRATFKNQRSQGQPEPCRICHASMVGQLGRSALGCTSRRRSQRAVRGTEGAAAGSRDADAGADAVFQPARSNVGMTNGLSVDGGLCEPCGFGSISRTAVSASTLSGKTPIFLQSAAQMLVT